MGCDAQWLSRAQLACRRRHQPTAPSKAVCLLRPALKDALASCREQTVSRAANHMRSPIRVTISANVREPSHIRDQVRAVTAPNGPMRPRCGPPCASRAARLIHRRCKARQADPPSLSVQAIAVHRIGIGCRNCGPSRKIICMHSPTNSGVSIITCVDHSGVFAARATNSCPMRRLEGNFSHFFTLVPTIQKR